VGITAKILQLVNSAFFSHIKEVTSIPLAVSYIGLDALRQIALSAAVFHTFQPVLPVAGFCFSSLGKHSWLAARIAAQLPSGKNAASAGIVASILHDAGKLVLASRMPHEFERAIQIGIDRGAPLHEVEEEVVGANHAEIGAYLLGLWGLPETVVEAVWRHHSPFVRPERDYGLDVLGITHIADALANETADPAPANVLAGGLNMEYLEQRNAVHLLDEWREMARRTAREERARN
jgi:HD-like signal output (HDOD) protein